MANLGFIGLGIMGKPMALHLIDGGHTLHVFNRTQSKMKALVDKGAIACTSPREAAMKSDVIFTIVSDTPDVEGVLFGENGVAAGAKTGAIVVDMSTISPTATKDFAIRLHKAGIEMMDAPVSGGQAGAEQAMLTIMCGGSQQTFDKVKPLLDLMGKNVNLIGDHGAGQTCKAANQIIVALTIEAVSEAMLFASKAGADPMKVRKALMGGFAQSRVLESHGERMLRRDFNPGFKTKLHQKDLNIVLQNARQLGMSLPGTALVQEMLNSLAGHGGSDLDSCALLTVLESMADWKTTAE